MCKVMLGYPYLIGGLGPWARRSSREASLNFGSILFPNGIIAIVGGDARLCFWQAVPIVAGRHAGQT